MIREATSEDIERINELTDELHTYIAGLYRLNLSPKELEEEHFDEEELGENAYLAETEEGNIIGYLSVSKRDNEIVGPHYEVDHIIVSEKYRRLNVGRMLFDIVLERAKRESVNITIETLARDEGALRFYEELGFRPLTIGLLLDLQGRIPLK